MVPKAAVVLHDAIVAQVLQKLDLTLQSVHLLQTNKKRENSVPVTFRHDAWCFPKVSVATFLSPC